MKRAKILHNPGAGDELYTKEELIKMISSNGYECEYCSVKEDDWDGFHEQIDFLIVAGGDDTVRRVLKSLLYKWEYKKKYPLALLPLGTANNLAKTLGIANSGENHLASWKELQLKKFSIGLVSGAGKADFFLEALGFGVFPELIDRMDKIEKEQLNTVEKKLTTALELIKQITIDFEPVEYLIEADGIDYSGRYLVVEVMNAKSIGPNLFLSPDADPSDGQFELVLIEEMERLSLLNYVVKKSLGEDIKAQFKQIKCRKIKIKSKSTQLHIDDELVVLNHPDAEIQVRLEDDIFEFLI